MNNRVFGVVMLILGAILLWFMASGALFPAPVLVVFAMLGGAGAVLIGLWGLIGKY